MLGREQSGRRLLEHLKKHVSFAQGLVLSTLPRGELQIVQPSNVSDALLKAYAEGFHTEDCISWQAIVRQKVVRADDCWDRGRFQDTPYYKLLMEPAGLRYVAAVPIAAPVLRGYPGVVHVLRTEQQGDFSDAELRKMSEFAAKLPGANVNGRASRGGGSTCAGMAGFKRPAIYLSIINEKLQPQLPSAWSALDSELRQRLAEQARRQLHSLNGHRVSGQRLQLADEHGDHWVFRHVTYKRYPALGPGSFSFFCLQPDCVEWSLVKPADFQADPELSRLIPALSFMEKEFSRGPRLREIAQIVDLSPFHFHRRFTELLGLTPKQFMLNCQTFQVKAELVAGDKELAQIAKDCGFAHQSHFTSRFKQATGLTPTRWRRMARARSQDSDN